MHGGDEHIKNFVQKTWREETAQSPRSPNHLTLL